MISKNAAKWYQEQLAHINMQFLDIEEGVIKREAMTKNIDVLAGHLRYLADKLEKENRKEHRLGSLQDNTI